MADTDVELVIKIPKMLISELDDDNYQSVISWYDTTLYCAIKDGLALPKGHGKLIDADELYGDFIDGTEGYDCQTWNRIEIGDIIEDAHTVIEADIDAPSPEEEKDR